MNRLRGKLESLRHGGYFIHAFEMKLASILKQLCEGNVLLFVFYIAAAR